MNKLLMLYNLISNHNNCFQGKFSIAEIEKIFKRGSENFHNNNINIRCLSIPNYIRKPFIKLSSVIISKIIKYKTFSLVE